VDPPSTAQPGRCAAEWAGVNISAVGGQLPTTSVQNAQRPAPPPSGPQGPPPGPPPTRGAQDSDDTSRSVLDSVSELLDLTTDEVTEALDAGTSLVDLAAQQGVSSEDLFAALTPGSTGPTGHQVDVRL
jgi:hypothetical protein